ncbi:MAG: ACT domain-containing protein [Pseudonocardiaceae bacterium]
MTALTGHRHTEQLAVCWLPADAPVPGWAAAPGRLRAAIRTSAELSIVCAMDTVPARVRHEGPFTAFEVEGPLELATTGVLAAMLAPLAAAGVSVFTLSTFDANWVLVPLLQHTSATRALHRAGHTVVQLDPESNPAISQHDPQHHSQQDPGRKPQ